MFLKNIEQVDEKIKLSRRVFLDICGRTAHVFIRNMVDEQVLYYD